MFKIFNKFGKSGKTSASAIILCAGASTRFGSNKQMATVSGKTVAHRTIEVFQSSPSVKEIILVVPKDDIKEYQDLIVVNDFKKVVAIVTGGDTRQASALRGLKHVSEKAHYIAIHDGARCLITEEIIQSVLNSAIENKCATAATRMTDTIKLSDEEGFVSKTIDREFLWSVQTPQIFEAEIYKIAAYKAKQCGFIATDDCMLAEKAGFKVKLVDVGKENIKITHPSDVLLAEQILRNRGESSQ